MNINQIPPLIFILVGILGAYCGVKELISSLRNKEKVNESGEFNDIDPNSLEGQITILWVDYILAEANKPSCFCNPTSPKI